MDTPQLKFSRETRTVSPKATGEWKLLIVDDEQEIHRLTISILQDERFEGKSMNFLSAYTGHEAKKLMRQHPDIAVIFLDVVMEQEQSGLEVARYVRKDLKNKMVRIVLRTGQAGQAPERKVITEYDINDYREKIELTAQKLYTVTIASLRSFRDLKMIEQNNRSLKRIVESSRRLIEKRSLQQFYDTLLIELVAFFQMNGAVPAPATGFVASHDTEQWIVTAGTGEFGNSPGRSVDEIVSAKDRKEIEKAVSKQRDRIDEHQYIGYFDASDSKKSLAFLKSEFEIGTINRNLLDLFSANIRTVFENIVLGNKVTKEHRDKISMQRGVLVRLNELIGLRSRETSNHVKRVAEYACIISRALGFTDEEVEILHLAAPLHDIGKIGIPDAILQKPGKLSKVEYETMKKHTDIGAEMLHDNNSQLLKASSTIAQYHHERWDGLGYPYGLKSDEIPLLGRITAICDVFDSLISKRCYKEPWPIEKAFEEIKNGRETRFDPELVDLFLKRKEIISAVVDKFSDD